MRTTLTYGIVGAICLTLGALYGVTRPRAQAAPTKPDFTTMTHQLETLKHQQLEIMAQLKLQNGLLLQELAGDVEEKVR